MEPSKVEYLISPKFQTEKRNISIRKGDRSLAQTRNVKPKTGFDAILQSNQVTKFNRQSSGDRKEQTWQIMSVCRNQITNGQSSGAE